MQEEVAAMEVLASFLYVTGYTIKWIRREKTRAVPRFHTVRQKLHGLKLCTKAAHFNFATDS